MHKNCHYFKTSLPYSIKSKVKKDEFKNAKRDIKPHKIKEKRKRKKLNRRRIKRAIQQFLEIKMTIQMKLSY